MEREPLVSVIVPVYADYAEAVRLLAQLGPDPRVEWILVDGAADPRFDVLAADRRDLRLLRAPPGRGVQLRAGAEAGRGAWLLFLHADSRLPAGWLPALAQLPASVRGGWFGFALDDAAWQARAIERGVRWRVRLFKLPYGDQGVFVRRGTYHAMGGLRPLPLMEDVDFVRRLARQGPTVELPLQLVTSARRWRRDGWWRRSARNVLLLLLYFAGVSPTHLARWYGLRSSSISAPRVVR